MKHLIATYVAQMLKNSSREKKLSIDEGRLASGFNACTYGNK